MKQLFVLFYFITAVACADIFETPHFDEIQQYVNPNTLVIVDIDDTLLIPVQTLGTDVWFCSRLSHHSKTQSDYALALDRALAEWEAVRHLTNVKIVEEGTQTILRHMQSQGVVIMGLTTQGLALATRTHMQLKSLGIELSLTPPSQDDFYFINGPHGVLYSHGILFTAGTSKGTALVKLLDQMNFHPDRVVFINDKLSHLKDLEKSVVMRNIEFIGLRYSFSDDRVANYSQEIADIQWDQSSFGRILSDSEAASLLNCTAE